MKIFTFSLLACVAIMGRAYAQNHPVRFSAISTVPTSSCPSVWDVLNNAYDAELESSQLYKSLEKLFATTDIEEFLSLARKISFYDSKNMLQDPDRDEANAKRILGYHLKAIATIYTISTFFVHTKMDDMIRLKKFERIDALINITMLIRKNLDETLTSITESFAYTFKKAESQFIIEKFMNEDLLNWNEKIDLYLKNLRNLQDT